MKKETLSKKWFFILVVVIIVTMPRTALSLTFSNIENDSLEFKDSIGPADVWAYLGLTGPGDGDVYFYDDGVRTITSSASMNIVTLLSPWGIGTTNSAFDNYHWSAIYSLNGDPGLAANIYLDYTYTNDHLNAAFDGRSQSQMIAGLTWKIVSASMYEEADKDFLDKYIENLLAAFISFSPLPYPDLFDEYESFYYNQEHYFAGMTFYDETVSGSIDLGTMTANDYLFMSGFHWNFTEAEAYAIGVTMATLVSTFEFELGINEIAPAPVPGPATILLLGSGLVGLAGFRKKKARR